LAKSISDLLSHRDHPECGKRGWDYHVQTPPVSLETSEVQIDDHRGHRSRSNTAHDSSHGKRKDRQAREGCRSGIQEVFRFLLPLLPETRRKRNFVAGSSFHCERELDEQEYWTTKIKLRDS